MYIKGKNLFKLHNCFFCHFKKNFLYPKINKQYFCYLVWSLLQYKNFFNRINFIMYSQIQNISISDIKSIIFFLNNNIF